MINVEVAYALPDQQKIIRLEVEPGTTAERAVSLSGIEKHFSTLKLEQAKLGIFGKVVKPEYELRAGDRVEIYRELIADPKEIRKQRAKAGKVMKKGGGEVKES